MIRAWLAVVALAATMPAQDAVLETIRLRPDVVLVRGGEGGNVLVVEAGDTLLLVDAREAAVGAQLLAALDRPVSQVHVVVNTHYHEDHIGGNALFPSAVHVAHTTVPSEARRDTTIDILGWHRAAVAEAAIPERLVAGDTTLDVAGRQVVLLHTPAAHTSGDLMVWLPHAAVLHMGDTFELGAYPFLDVWAGGSIDGMIAASDRALALIAPTTIVVPGHGPPSDAAGLRAYRAMLVAVRRGVQRALETGLSLDSTMGLGITAPFDGTYGSPRAGRRFVGLVYLSLDGLP